MTGSMPSTVRCGGGAPGGERGVWGQLCVGRDRSVVESTWTRGGECVCVE